jgi:hypothetical protein
MPGVFIFCRRFWTFEHPKGERERVPRSPGASRTPATGRRRPERPDPRWRPRRPSTLTGTLRVEPPAARSGVRSRTPTGLRAVRCGGPDPELPGVGPRGRVRAEPAAVIAFRWSFTRILAPHASKPPCSSGKRVFSPSSQRRRSIRIVGSSVYLNPTISDGRPYTHSRHSVPLGSVSKRKPPGRRRPGRL